MAIILTGVPGSGKSYKAMYDMYYQQDKYHKIFTNIDGLKKTDKILPLNFKKFTDDILTECYNLIVTQSKEYEDVISYLQRIYMLPEDVSKDNRIMLVIDEAQNYFNKKNLVLLWFITQHRHLYFELVLITQHQRLIHTDYHIFNTAYFAFPPVKQFSKNKISYNEFAGLPLNEDNFVRKFSLKKEDEIFDMYVSGDKVESPNILKRFILILLMAIAIIAFGIYYFKNMYGHSNDTVKVDHNQKFTVVTTSTDISIPTVSEIRSDVKLYTFILFEDYFTMLDNDSGGHKSLKLFAYIKKHYFVEMIDVIIHDSYHSSIVAVCDSKLDKLLSIKKNNKRLSEGIKNVTSFN